jgi:hypothetical protein
MARGKKAAQATETVATAPANNGKKQQAPAPQAPAPAPEEQPVSDGLWLVYFGESVHVVSDIGGFVAANTEGIPGEEELGQFQVCQVLDAEGNLQIEPGSAVNWSSAADVFEPVATAYTLGRKVSE